MQVYIARLKHALRPYRKLYLVLGWILGFHRNAIMRISRLLKGMDNNMVVFSAFNHYSYNDNPRYISEKLHELRPETKIVWLFKDVAEARAKYDIPDYVQCMNSIARNGVAAMGRARIVVDNYAKRFYLKFPAKEQIYIQTWHGDRAFKKVGFDFKGQHLRMLEEHATLGITGSDYGDRQFRSAFHYKGEIMKVGYPRNDILVRNDPAEREAIRRKLKVSEDVCLLLYAPTFRDVEQRAHSSQKVTLDVQHVLDTLEKTTGREWKCLVRAHYLSYGIKMEDTTGRLIPASDYPEMAELLLAADALITDYSSCAGDYALLRRPIFLYQDDLEDYRSKSRDLYFDMKDSPYWVASTPDEMDALIEASTPERAKENCNAILEFYGEAETGHAAQSIAEYIVDKLDAYQNQDKRGK